MTDHPDTVQVGGATLLLGDCIERMHQLPDCSVDLVLADPPYCSGATREAGKTNFRKTMTPGTRGNGRWFGSDSLTTRGFQDLLRRCALEWQRILVPGGHALIFIDWRMEAAAADAIESADLRRAGLLIWDKVHFTMGSCFRNRHELILHFTKGIGSAPLRRDVPNVLAFPAVRLGLHPTEKPQPLLRTLIETVCPEAGVVLDPFFGSCSAGAAAAATGRHFVGIERDRRYYDVGWQRLVDLQEAATAA